MILHNQLNVIKGFIKRHKKGLILSRQASRRMARSQVGFAGGGNAVEKTTGSYNDMIGVHITEHNAGNTNLAEAARFTLNYLSHLIRLVEESHPEIIQQFHFGRMLNEFEFWKEVEPGTVDQSN